MVLNFSLNLLDLRISVMDCGVPTVNITSQMLIYDSGSPPTITIYNSVFTVRCQIGFRFSDLSQVKQLTCRSDGTWGPFVACQGKLFELFQLNLIDDGPLYFYFQMRNSY